MIKFSLVTNTLQGGIFEAIPELGERNKREFFNLIDPCKLNKIFVIVPELHMPLRDETFVVRLPRIIEN
jgi:hypothetical protein